MTAETLNAWGFGPCATCGREDELVPLLDVVPLDEIDLVCRRCRALIHAVR